MQRILQTSRIYRKHVSNLKKNWILLIGLLSSGRERERERERERSYRRKCVKVSEEFLLTVKVSRKKETEGLWNREN